MLQAQEARRSLQIQNCHLLGVAAATYIFIARLLIWLLVCHER
jgi:hypothetical protein